MVTPGFPSRFIDSSAARARFGDRVDRLGAYLTRVDPAADAVVEAFETMPRGAGWALFRRAAQAGIASVPEAPDALRGLFTEVERDGRLKTFDRRFRFVQLEVDLAKLMTDLAVLRPFADQFQQQRLGHDVLLCRHQGLNQVGACRPMA